MHPHSQQHEDEHLQSNIVSITNYDKCLILFDIPCSEEIPDDRNGTYSQAIDNAAANDPQIVMVVMRSPNEEK